MKPHRSHPSFSERCVRDARVGPTPAKLWQVGDPAGPPSTQRAVSDDRRLTDRFILPSSGSMLDLIEVAARLGISVKTVRRMVQRGELPVHRIGRLLRVSEADLVMYVAARRKNVQ